MTEICNKILLIFQLTHDKAIRICYGAKVPQSRPKLAEVEKLFATLKGEEDLKYSMKRSLQQVGAECWGAHSAACGGSQDSPNREAKGAADLMACSYGARHDFLCLWKEGDEYIFKLLNESAWTEQSELCAWSMLVG